MSTLVTWSGVGSLSAPTLFPRPCSGSRVTSASPPPPGQARQTRQKPWEGKCSQPIPGTDGSHLFLMVLPLHHLGFKGTSSIYFVLKKQPRGTWMAQSVILAQVIISLSWDKTPSLSPSFSLPLPHLHASTHMHTVSKQINKRKKNFFLKSRIIWFQALLRRPVCSATHPHEALGRACLFDPACSWLPALSSR